MRMPLLNVRNAGVKAPAVYDIEDVLIGIFRQYILECV